MTTIKLKRGLSRGLDSLLSDRAKNLAQSLDTTILEGSTIRDLPLAQLQRGRYQPRRDFTPENLQELADSIKKQGVLQPIIVRKLTGQQYEIIAGERRWRAAQLAQLTTIPAIVRELSDSDALAIAIIENIQRQDLNALEEAQSLQRLIDEFKLTQQEVADAVGKSRVAVTNLLRLLKLNSDVKDLLQTKQIEMGHARALLALAGSEQSQTAKNVVHKKLSVRETEQLVNHLLSNKSTPSVTHKPSQDPDVLRLQTKLSETLGAKISIKHKGPGGSLEIHYFSLDELDGILEHIK